MSGGAEGVHIDARVRVTEDTRHAVKGFQRCVGRVLGITDAWVVVRLDGSDTSTYFRRYEVEALKAGADGVDYD